MAGMLHWYIKPKIIRGNDLKMPAAPIVDRFAPTLNPSEIEGLVPCSRKAIKKMVKTINKLTRTDTKAENLRAVSFLGNDNGNKRHYSRLDFTYLRQISMPTLFNQ
jgi:hypothetical protein